MKRVSLVSNTGVTRAFLIGIRTNTDRIFIAINYRRCYTVHPNLDRVWYRRQSNRDLAAKSRCADRDRLDPDRVWSQLKVTVQQHLIQIKPNPDRPWSWSKLPVWLNSWPTQLPSRERKTRRKKENECEDGEHSLMRVFSSFDARCT